MPTRSADDATLTGQSAGITRLRRQIVKVAAASAPVLIWGESGSGKELAAQAVHAHSARRKGPFVPIKCAVNVAVGAGLTRDTPDVQLSLRVPLTF